jgi:hypothetical protein
VPKKLVNVIIEKIKKKKLAIPFTYNLLNTNEKMITINNT